MMSNTCAIIAAVAAGFVPNGWWIDPAGAILISLYIVSRWIAIAKEQVGWWIAKEQVGCTVGWCGFIYLSTL